MPRVRNFNYAAPGTSVTGWFDVADRAENHTCQERRRYGRCNCGSGKKRNPCQEAINISLHCLIRGLSKHPISLDGGNIEVKNGTIEAMAVATIYAFFKRKTCHQSRANHNCNHAGCIKTEAVLDWLEEQIASAAFV